MASYSICRGESRNCPPSILSVLWSLMPCSACSALPANSIQAVRLYEALALEVTRSRDVRPPRCFALVLTARQAYQEATRINCEAVEGTESSAG
jgi:hypothetical protein